MASDLLTDVRRELDERLRELRPLLAEYERLLAAARALDADGTTSLTVTRTAPRRSRRARGRRGRAGAGMPERASATTARRARTGSSSKRSPRGVAREAILAALEHGSHTASELATVSALSAPSIQNTIRRLMREGAVAKTQRDGRPAYALRSADS